MLTPAHIAFFQANGYLVVEDVVAPALLTRLRRIFRAAGCGSGVFPQTPQR